MTLRPKVATGLSWLARIVAAAILGSAGVAKLTSAPDSVTLFTLLHAEPWGRYLLGVVELLTVVLLLWPRGARYGGVLGIVLMLGAIATHIFRIGITYGGDPGLFLMAVTVLLASTATVVLQRSR